MKKYEKYKIAVWILSFIVIIEGVSIIVMMLSRPKAKKVALAPPVKLKGEIAIVIDDWGYNLNYLAVLDQIKSPLTMSVLPNLKFSEAIAAELHKRGFEVILHLPMEPYEKYNLEKNTILISMDEAEIRNILKKDLDNVCYAVGVNNHMGSRATADPKTMEIVFKELKRRKLYFLDSLVSRDSVCANLAKKSNLAFAKRDIFLDNLEKAEYIRGQISKLKTKSRIYGKAIGIGHARKITLEVLKEVMPEIEREGYRLVFVSELIR